MPKKVLIAGPKKKRTSHGQNGNTEIRDARLDFSAANNEKMTCNWMGAIKKKEDVLPAIYQCALTAAGVGAKQLDDDMDSSSENGHADIESETDTPEGDEEDN